MQEQTAKKQPVGAERDQKRFAVLVVLATVLILLLWVATIPINYGSGDNEVAGPVTFFQKIGQQLNITSKAVGGAAKAITNAE